MGELGLQTPDDTFEYNMGDLDHIAYQNLMLKQNWRSYDLDHSLTDAGLSKFMQDWQSIIK